MVSLALRLSKINKTRYLAYTFGSGLVAFSLINRRDSKNGKINPNASQKFTRNDVAAHNSLNTGVWITYKKKVYDISKFVAHHPGGSEIIMMGAGGDVEPFWETYTFHKEKQVIDLLNTYFIGDLDTDNETETQPVQSNEENDPYYNDPERSQLLKIMTAKPCNAETPSKLLIANRITPTELLFVRNHLPVPEVDIEDYRLEICIGTDGDEDTLNVISELTFNDIMTKFPTHNVETVIQCSGNRRNSLQEIKEIKGLSWNVGAIGNVIFKGVRLTDVIEYLLKTGAIKEADLKRCKHLQMQGLDSDMSGQHYGSSISSDVAFDPRNEVLIAFEMNGEPLTRDHGYPLRLVAPGITGARNVKWLSKLILSEEESNSHWQRKDYKSFSPNVNMFNVDFSKSMSIQEMPVQSAICDPESGDTVKITPIEDKENKQYCGTFPVKGYAYSGGGKMIIRVDISIDGGKTWTTANLEQVEPNEAVADRNRTWRWTRWDAVVEVPTELLADSNGKNGKLELLCRAFDSAYNSQPERAETVWNVRGVVNNSWHRVELNVVLDKQVTTKLTNKE